MGLRKKQKHSSLRLTDKKHPPLAIGATVIGFLSAILFFAVCLFSSESHGKAGVLIGLWGIMCFVLSVVGFIMSWISLHQENIRTLFPTIASLINGLLMVFYLMLYIWGSFV